MCAVLAASACVWAAGPPQAGAQEPDRAFVDRVVASLTPDERVGQLVMVNFIGDDVSAASDIAALIRDYKVGAVLITASNGNIINRDDTPAQIAGLTDGLQQRAFEASRRADAGNEYFLPLLIATDNEGDLFPLSNVTHNYTQVPDNMAIGATWSRQHAETVGAVVGRELSAAGINMLLGPVVDVLDNPRSGGNGDIGVRSFGGNPAWVGELGRAYVRGVHAGSDGRMLTVVKHFPGHGGSDRGTDNEVPTVNKSLEQLRASELTPFAETDRSDDADPQSTTDAMMVSHIRYRNFVQTATSTFTRPISLDPSALKALMELTEFSKWRASHLIMSDSLGVPAVRKWYAQQEGQTDFPNQTVVRDALMSGSDLLPLVEFYRDPDHRGWKDNQLPTIQDSIVYMRKQYAADPDFRRRTDDAVRHVIAEKVKLYPGLRLAQAHADPAAATAAAGSAADDMKRIAEDALTLIQPQTVDELRARLPRGPVTPDKVLIVECWADCYSTRVKGKLDLQNQLLALYGPAGSGRLLRDDVTTISYGELDAWLNAPSDSANAATAKSIADASWVILALAEYNPIGRPVSGAAKRFLDATPIDLRNKNLVAISYNVPYHLDSTEISKLAAYFVVYSKTDAAVDSGFRALFGDATPKGHSPVNVSGIFYNVADAVQPDPGQELRVIVFGQDADKVRDAANVALVAGPVLDRNGNPVPNGTSVSFSIARSGGASSTASGLTSDGLASSLLPLTGQGTYAATASVGGIASKPLALVVVPGAGAGVTSSPTQEPLTEPVQHQGRDLPVLALAIGIPVAVIAFAGLMTAAVLWLRRRQPVSIAPALVPAWAPASNVADSSEGTVSSVVETPPPQLLRVDLETHRVYVHGGEARPPFSSDQFRLLAYLYERAGKVVAREDLVRHVWPDAHVEGVSEEALDALVRRVRERIVQAGGERSYILTLRGQGFRLDVEPA